jgi:hypothetical protein
MSSFLLLALTRDASNKTLTKFPEEVPKFARRYPIVCVHADAQLSALSDANVGHNKQLQNKSTAILSQ